MDTQRIFEVLEIDETKEESLIREAYRRKLTSVNPEDNPEGFKRLRAAYEAAMKYAAQREEETAETKAADPVSLYMERGVDIYHSLSKRLDSSEWERLLKDELLDDLDLGEDAKWKLFGFLAGHYELPVKIWHMLERTFHVEREQQKFKERLPVNFVDFVIWSCSEDAELAQFPYDQLTGSDTADYDEFIHQLNALTTLYGREKEYEDKTSWLKELEQKIAFLDTLAISHPRFDLEKARYAYASGRQEEALQMTESMLSSGTTDPRLILGCAKIRKSCGREEAAEQVYRAFLDEESSEEQPQDRKPLRHREGDTYTAAFELADILARRREYAEAREFSLRARRIYHTPEIHKLLMDCNNGVIEQMTGEQAPAEELTPEEGLRLADCYIQTDRAAEGVAYFEQHPVLTEDTAKCHRTKATLFCSGGKKTEALAETLLWRRCLEEDPETEPDTLIHSYILEAKIYELFYREQEDKHSQSALSAKESAYAAFENALKLQPEDINVRMGKLMFLRALWEEDPDREYYQQAADLCEELKKLDSNNFWAYYYAQEAYEKLGKAQEVVDHFYQARRIYAKIPEIYERAAKVFQEYHQFQDMSRILKLAEEAGVESVRLKVLKIEALRVEAQTEEQLRDADAYSESILLQLEEQLRTQTLEERELKSLRENLAEAYRQRVLLHDDNGKTEGFKKLDDIEKWANRSVELADIFTNHYFLGYFYLYEKRDYQKAYEHLKICEKNTTTAHWVYFRLARIHEEWKNWDDAIQYYKKGLETAPKCDEYPWRIAWLYRNKFRRTGQPEYYQEALKYLDLHKERFGEDFKTAGNDLWWQYSDLHARNGEYQKALEEIERALGADDRRIRDFGHKAMLLYVLKRTKEAVAAYKDSIERSWKGNRDYTYAFTQLYEHYVREKLYKEGLEWFEAMQKRVVTEDLKKENWGRISYFYVALGDRLKALEALKKQHGGVTLTDYVCDSWEKEGQRIRDLLEAYQHWLTPEKLREKLEKAIALLENEAGQRLAESHDGKHLVYAKVALCYTNCLMEDETSLYYYQKAYEEAKLAGDETDNSDVRSVIMNIMDCLWHLGRAQEARPYREQYIEKLAEYYRECAELEKDPLQLHEEDCCRKRQNYYHLFKLDFFCGEYQKAAEWLKRMDSACWCWFCTAKDCTEAWECKGYMALINGDTEEAADCFERADACGWQGNEGAAMERKRLNL